MTKLNEFLFAKMIGLSSLDSTQYWATFGIDNGFSCAEYLISTIRHVIRQEDTSWTGDTKYTKVIIESKYYKVINESSSS